ncbi:GNAT family N-acetyltransferase [Actinomadura sp. 21ATH]|uniref:GNAT family N-acetyltransferase n=1 Tax=Actinomadura sp. 21ATH TaxID=1735444 RepID=UPI0035C070A6
MDLRDVVIRLGTAADAVPAARLVSLADVERRGVSPEDARERERAPARLTDAATFFYVGEAGGAGGDLVSVAAGMAGRADGGAGAPIPGLCHITMVAVRPGYWGRGLGKQVLRAVVTEARRRGYERAQLFTQAANHRARALYERQGFVLTGRSGVDAVGDELVHYLLSPVREDQGLHA